MNTVKQIHTVELHPLGWFHRNGADDPKSPNSTSWAQRHHALTAVCTAHLYLNSETDWKLKCFVSEYSSQEDTLPLSMDESCSFTSSGSLFFVMLHGHVYYLSEPMALMYKGLLHWASFSLDYSTLSFWLLNNQHQTPKSPADMYSALHTPLAPKHSTFEIDKKGWNIQWSGAPS